MPGHSEEKRHAVCEEYLAQVRRLTDKQNDGVDQKRNFRKC